MRGCTAPLGGRRPLLCSGGLALRGPSSDVVSLYNTLGTGRFGCGMCGCGLGFGGCRLNGVVSDFSTDHTGKAAMEERSHSGAIPISSLCLGPCTAECMASRSCDCGNGSGGNHGFSKHGTTSVAHIDPQAAHKAVYLLRNL